MEELLSGERSGTPHGPFKTSGDAFMKNMKQLSLWLCKAEGKKVQMPKAQIDEVLARLSELLARLTTWGAVMVLDTLIQNGKRRLKKFPGKGKGRGRKNKKA